MQGNVRPIPFGVDLGNKGVELIPLPDVGSYAGSVHSMTRGHFLGDGNTRLPVAAGDDHIGPVSCLVQRTAPVSRS